MQVPDPGSVAVFIPIAGMLTGAVIVITLGWTVRHWVDRHYGRDEMETGADMRGTLDEMRRRMSGVEELSERVQDLEERLDFAERVLAQVKDRPLLPPREDG